MDSYYLIVSVSIYSDLEDYPNIRALAQDFKAYKQGKLEPSYFGRDGDYSRPKECKEEDVWHLHLQPLRPSDKHPWAFKRLPYYRTSDRHLVYCRGYNDPNSFLLITVLEPEAHSKGDNIDLMKELSEIAYRFRLEH